MKTIFILIAVIFTFVNSWGNVAQFAGSDYQRFCSGGQHTMSLYRNPQPAPQCGRVENRGVSREIQSQILNLHNERRQYVASGRETRGRPGPQPRAKYMPNLQWDAELANIAQRWADQCRFSHDQCRDVGRFKVGQNIAIMRSDGQDSERNIVEKLILMWYNEVAQFDRSNVARFRSLRDGHYTQMMWAKTTRIGCGLIKYRTQQLNLFLVCNYGEAGNYMNQPVYETYDAGVYNRRPTSGYNNNYGSPNWGNANSIQDGSSKWGNVPGYNKKWNTNYKYPYNIKPNFEGFNQFAGKWSQVPYWG